MLNYTEQRQRKGRLDSLCTQDNLHCFLQNKKIYFKIDNRKHQSKIVAHLKLYRKKFLNNSIKSICFFPTSIKFLKAQSHFSYYSPSFQNFNPNGLVKCTPTHRKFVGVLREVRPPYNIYIYIYIAICSDFDKGLTDPNEREKAHSCGSNVFKIAAARDPSLPLRPLPL